MYVVRVECQTGWFWADVSNCGFESDWDVSQTGDVSQTEDVSQSGE